MLPGISKHNLALIWDYIVQYYREHRSPTQICKLQLNMFHHPRTYPCLTTKAKETQYLILAIHWIWKQLMNPSDAHNVSVELALQSLETVFQHSKRVGPDT